jgi:hypothetical protein
MGGLVGGRGGGKQGKVRVVAQALLQSPLYCYIQYILYITMALWWGKYSGGTKARINLR